MKRYRFLWFFIPVLLTRIELYAITEGSIPVNIQKLPLIQKLDSRNALFIQYSNDVEQAYMSFARNEIPQLFFYAYKAQKSDTIFTIAARCSIPYETIATVNDIPDTSIPLVNRIIVLPTVAGIFIPEHPNSAIEILLKKKHNAVLDENTNICYTINQRVYHFLENERFSSTERAFFLDPSLKMPLEHSWLSSPYGMRISPITGKWKFHEGIDLAAPEGSKVFACKSGTVSICGYNPVYGNYIVLKHTNGMSSLYAHLFQILVKKGDTVFGGSVIGKVGMTGEATGPHLHFEIRINNIPANPQNLLKK